MLVDYLQKNNERIQKLKELVFNRTWLMQILMIQLGEQYLRKYCVIKQLIFAKNAKCDGCKRGLALIVYKFFDKKNLAVLK